MSEFDIFAQEEKDAAQDRRIAELMAASKAQLAAILDLQGRIEVLELSTPDQTASPDFMAEFNQAAATDDTPDPIDTRLAERPL